MEVDSSLCISPTLGSADFGIVGSLHLQNSSIFSINSQTNVKVGLEETDSSSMDVDPMVNLFAFNNCNSPSCNRQEYNVFNAKGADVKPDRSSSASADSMEPLTCLQSKHYNVTSLSTGHYQNSPCFNSSSPSFYSQTNYSYNNSINSSHSLANNVHQSNGSVAYSVHTHQPVNSSNGYNANQAYSEYGPHSPPMHFPTASMSVNLSMNMTMGFSGNDPQPVQWNAPITSSSPYQTNYPNQVPPNSVSYLNHMHASAYPSSSPTSYTITAEFRPSEHLATTLPPIEKEFAGVCSIKPAHPSIYPYHKNVADSFHHDHCQTNKAHRTSESANYTQNLDQISFSKSTPNSASLSNLCRICGKTYARPSTLKTHLRTHSGERPYRCNTCNKSFSQAANLTAHIRTHSGEKPFRCPVCDRRFSQSSSVTTHMRTHSGERPYRCNMCKKAFSDSSTLTKHLRIHSGEKPYQCKLCMLRFSQSGNLNRHMRIHSS